MADLRAGASVSVLVRERLGADSYRVSLGPRLLTAISTRALEPGSVLKARVERAGDAVVLRVLTAEAREAAALPAAGLPNDAAARAALAALLREGVGPEPRSLMRVRRAALRDEAEGGDWSDLAAKMEAKGMSAEAEALEALAAAASDADGRREAGDGAGGEVRSESAPAESAEELSIPEGDFVRVFARVLRGLATRTAGVEPGRPALTLALFNHARGPEGSWVILPFRFSLDAVDFAGSFRIQLPYLRGGQGRFEARFSASRGTRKEDWAFFLDFGGGPASALRIERPEGSRRAAAGPLFEEFAAVLAALSCSTRLSFRDQGAAPRSRGLDLDA
jgi:hypothetical protein